MNGVQHYLWRAVDQNGAVIDILVQPRRDHWAALRSFRKLRISEPWRNVGRSRVAYPPHSYRSTEPLRRASCKDKTVSFTATVTDSQAQALAQFLKRRGFSEMRQKAVDDEEAYLMVDACEKVRDALAGVGYNPR
jgi:hypothetical protein